MAPGTSAMPDPPRKRQKLTTTACEPCRSRKIRCDGGKPSCEACSKRAQQCIYQATADINSANAYVDSLVNRIAQLEQELESARATILKLSTAPAITAPPAAPPPHHNIDPRLLPDDDAISLEPGSVDAMGGDAGIADIHHDDHTFYGSSSALGFTRQMYGTILHRDTESPVSSTAASTSAQQLPASTTSYVAPENFSLLPRELADRLMFLYWDRVHVLYPFLHKASFSQAYEDLWKPSTEHRRRDRPGLGLGASRESGPSSVIFHCAFNAALALGMQFSDLPLSEKERLSAACLAKSKDLLKLDLFDDGNMALIQTLLLLTQYFQSTNWPSKCWTSIGLACRLAQGLGLHIEEDRLDSRLANSDREMRRRVWHGCVTLDIIVSMTLGRPAMLVGSSARSLPASMDGDEDLPVALQNDKISSIDFFAETVKLYQIVGLILLNMYKFNNEAGDPDEENHYSSLIELDQDLNQFQQNLPAALTCRGDQRVKPQSGILARQAHVLHVRFLHARILLYRPSFLHFCRTHNASQSTPRARSNDSASAEHCVRTACDLLSFIRQHSATEATGAWWYNVFYTRSAAMVVLLSAVCPAVHSQVGDEAWLAAWADCVAILTVNLPQYRPVKTCLATLEALRGNVLRQRAEHGLPDLGGGGGVGTKDTTDVRMQVQDVVDHGDSSRDAHELSLPTDASQYLLDSVFDPFAFVEQDLFTDLGFDFTQPLL